jgi:hypothetical protein
MGHLSTMHRRDFLTTLAALTLGRPALAQDDGFAPLWNGRDFDGWRKVGGGATYRVDGDCIVGEVGPGPNTFLRTEKSYGDFILKVEAKLEVPGNSGIQFRSRQRDGNGRVFGYQCEIDPSARAWSAGIYDEGRRGWLNSLEGNETARKALKPTEWNRFVIEARGPHLRTWLNDVPCADLLDPMDLDGFIALQVHSGKEGRIRWRNVLLKDLGRSEWRPLWDGRTLAGWEPSGAGEWKIVDGVLHGIAPKAEGRQGHLLTREQYGEFAIRLKYFAPQGNSGLHFRVEKTGDAAIVAGFHADIDPEQARMRARPNDWNELSVIAHGGRVVAHLNGFRVAELKDPGSRKGHIGLRLGGGPDRDVQLKDIEILPRP